MEKRRKTMKQIEIEKWISLDEAAEFLGIKPVTLRKWIKTKEDLPAHKVGRLWKFKCTELDEWVRSDRCK